MEVNFIFLKENQILKDFNSKILKVEFDINFNDFDIIIDKLLENKKIYIIDCFPKAIKDCEKYNEIENFFKKKYSKKMIKDRFADDIFAEKITKIILILISYYKVIIYYSIIPSKEFKKFERENINCYLKISNLIHFIVTRDWGDINFFIKDKNDYFLFSIRGGYWVDIYSPTEEALKLIKQLVCNEGLFLREC